MYYSMYYSMYYTIHYTMWLDHISGLYRVDWRHSRLNIQSVFVTLLKVLPDTVSKTYLIICGKIQQSLIIIMYIFERVISVPCKNFSPIMIPSVGEGAVPLVNDSTLDVADIPLDKLFTSLLESFYKLFVILVNVLVITILRFSYKS